MNIDLCDKNALVCGGSQGIGKAAAIELAELGASVCLLSRDITKLNAAKKELPVIHDYQYHEVIAVNLSDESQIINEVSKLVKQKDIHILINNSGGPTPGPLTEATTSELRTAFQHHVLASHIISSLVVPSMKLEEYGRIINVTSISVKTPISGLGVSNTIRGAMSSWSKTMANELGPFGITVNNVLPGYTRTDRLLEVFEAAAQKQSISVDELIAQQQLTIPARRIGEPSELGSVIAFLASPAASYVNGVTLTVDGGRTPAF